MLHETEHRSCNEDVAKQQCTVQQYLMGPGIIVIILLKSFGIMFNQGCSTGPGTLFLLSGEIIPAEEVS